MRAVLFDLDGTLLDIDLDSFLRRYFDALGSATAASFPGTDVMPHILASTGAMQRVHEGRTNRSVFDADFLTRTGIDLTEAWGVFEDFYRDVFPTLGEDCRPAEGAREAVDTALELGLKVAIATQPIFPRAAIEHRLAWAGLSDLTFDAVTTYEWMEACKPHAAYFRQTAALLEVEPVECLMVGDDRSLDMPAADIGMRTYYVGPDAGVAADFRGPISDLPDLLRRMAR